jgi:RNase P/RNase MRP subunit p29
METALTRIVVIKTTAWTLVIVESAARTVITTAFTVFVIEATAGTVTKLTVAEPTVATVVIKSAFTSRLIAKTSLFMSFLVTVTVIELEGPPLLEHFGFVNRLSGARTLARSFVVSHLIIMY